MALTGTFNGPPNGGLMSAVEASEGSATTGASVMLSRCQYFSSASLSWDDLWVRSSSCSTSVSADSGYQYYRTLTMPVSDPTSTRAVTVWPDCTVLRSAGSTILKA
jgi:hypothetical protein